MSLGLIVKNRRKELGLTQVELSKLMGISRGYLANIESNNIIGTLDLCKKLSKALDKPLSYFLEDDKIKVNTFEALDCAVEMLLDAGHIGADGKVDSWGMERLIPILEKEIELKVRNIKEGKINA